LRNIGVTVRDSRCFFEDGAEVLSGIGAECSWDVLPDHISRSNMDTCPSTISVMLSHLLDYSDLLHEKAGTLSRKSSAFPGDR
jgi:hypothetical protein